MFTKSKIKVSPALIIFLAFIFRLCFANICFFQSSGTTSNNKSVATQKSSQLKKRRRDNNEAVVKSTLENYVTVEVCEETQDSEEVTAKATTPILLSFLFSLFTKITNSQVSISLFDTIKCSLYPKKYLALSTLRV